MTAPVRKSAGAAQRTQQRRQAGRNTEVAKMPVLAGLVGRRCQ